MKKKTVILFLDLSKAFDCVAHELLLKKAENYGLRGKAQDWLRSYLKDREQYVEIRMEHGHVRSSSRRVECGVPQGSVLGPLLFTLYINDLPHFISDKADIVMYADDCALVVSDKDQAALEKKILDVVNLTRHWFDCNSLKVNMTKSSLMHVRSSHLTRNLWYVSLDKTLAKDIVTVSDIRFLGVHVDSYFSYNLHVDTLELKLRQGSYLMKKLVNYCDLPTIRSVYFSYFQSKLVYCLSSWGFISAGNITKIFRIQKKLYE